ncbi:Nucleotidyltransferase substrate binding family protein [Desulfonema limicola]|uniref:Nucleotidyltransferase substrate binding family protein n=1 Tax=Desulfonema limicola TaxID=45656 RepID=A0A975B9A1_9BACT|nr:HI0074 family nucleotidyltransferase substrate-binding subunit [Desulfonema limicola]QTA81145.1 Nucleotidyltransferase substrate binding family protein [Desulfonema limicola]
MNNKKDIRWKQRFENFNKAYQTFWRILDIEEPNEAERMGLVQAFEIVFELSWKTVKDYLFEQGFQEKSPRGVLKQAFQNGIIVDGHSWIDALQNRNETVHIYDEEMAKKIDNKIRTIYAPIIRDLYFYLKKEYDNE